MSQQIPTAFVNQFRSTYDHLVQQMDSKLAATVTQESLTGEFGYRDQIGGVMPVERTTRHGDTPFTEVPHARRQYSARDWEMGEIIDRQDTERALISPQSAYAEAFAAGMNRRRDRTIISAMFATALTGKAGGTSVPFPSGQQIAVDYVETGSNTNSSLTLGKLRRARELLVDVGGEDDDLYIACTQREISALLRTTEYTSTDFGAIRALEDGREKRFMGFNFIVLPNIIAGTSERMFDLDGSNHRRIPCWSKKGVLFAQLMGTEINAAPDPTKGFNTRLHIRASFGATRLEEPRVVEIKCLTTGF